tara:strand:- start:145 stop:402 length:258 start_codon:yes stop_codon:yes gene_type:complete
MLKLEITITELQDGSISIETDEWTQGDVSLNEERYAGAIVGTIEAMNDSMDEADRVRLEREMAAELASVELETPADIPVDAEERE